ncbi:hypothetical protein, variant [Phialophora macrospora]|nr:hypothetical protein, variant [Phialophora macrospora]
MDKKIDELPINLISTLQSMKLKASDLQQMLGPKRPFSSDKIAENFKKMKINVDAKHVIEKQMEFIESHIVPRTFSWLGDEAYYKSWVKGQISPFIYISGSSGAGKTYLTYKCYRLIQDMSKSRPAAGEPERARQSISIACFLFEPGKDDAQSLQTVLVALILQIAEQDPKLCDAIGKESEKIPTDNEEKRLQYLWESLMVKKFEKTSENSRVLYVLLDGIEQMKEEEREKMLKWFQALDGDKNFVRILMTGPPDMLKRLELKSLRTIDLDQKTKEKGDVSEIIDYRIKNSEALKALSANAQDKIKARLNSWKKSVMSSVDLMLRLLEQSESPELAAVEDMKGAENPEWLYNTMIKIVKPQGKRSEVERKSVERLYAWCTYAKQPLRIDQLQHLWTLEPSLGSFDVTKEIQGMSSSLLYTIKTSDDQLLSGSDPDAAEASKVKPEYVSFRQPAFREHLETPDNKMIEDPMQEKIDIFVTLCKILCDRDAAGASARKALQEYAATTFIQHLRDIDIKKTTSKQGKDVVEALARVLTNDNDVCAVFEANANFFDDFDLYEITETDTPRRWETAGELLAWAKKMHFHEEEELSPRARAWVEATIRAPQKVLETLGRGHLSNWALKMTAQDASTPYRLAYRALYTSLNWKGLPGLLWTIDITSHTANVLLEYGRKHCFPNGTNYARARIAAALLLNESHETECRERAAQLYQANLRHKSTPGPAKFYSALGLAEYHAHAKEDKEPEDQMRKRWEMVRKYTQEALAQGDHERGALGTDLNNERRTAAYLLLVDAWRKLDQDDEALAICQRALQPGELEYSQEMLRFLTTIVAIRFQRGEYAQIVDEVQRQPLQVKCEWMYYRSDIWTNKEDQLRQAAVRSGRVDFVIHLYEDAIDYWQTKASFQTGVLQCELAEVYRRDARVTKMADRILDGMIRGNSAMLKGGIISNLFPMKVDILFETYTLTQSEVTKGNAIAGLEELISAFEQADILEPIVLARAMITLAKMRKSWRSDGDKAAMKDADQAFKLCIADLEDSIGSNDSNALRTLAKVLMFADFHLDAEIALSLQFSEVKEYDDSNPRYGWDEDEPAESVTTAEPDHDHDHEDDDQKSDISDPEEVESASLAGAATSQARADNDQNGEVVPATESAVLNHQEPSQNDLTAHLNANGIEAADSVEESTSREHFPVEDLAQVPNSDEFPAKVDHSVVEINGVHADDQAPVEAPDVAGEHNSDRPPSPAASSRSAQDAQVEIKEDLLGFFIYCSGPCAKTTMDRWPLGGAKFYFCLDCSEVDLCSECYHTQRRYYTENAEGFWFRCCWAQHQYIESPTKDWRGVRNGVIRIGEKNKLWVDWLDTVKEKWGRQMARLN